MFQKLVFTGLIICCFACGSSQYALQSEGKATHRIAFYNVENLFDIYDDPGKADEEFMPESKKKWTEERYNKKLNDLSRVFEAIDFPSVIGLCEVENERVLKDLTQTDAMKKHGYEFVHFESPDFRGIDNGLLYKTNDLKILSSDHYPINFPKAIVEDYTTRDILHVKGLFLNRDTVHFFVNHWPSRRGGLKESEPKRLFVAQQLKAKTDAILKQNPSAKIIVMGDFNDEPDNNSVANTLGAKNPMDLKKANDQQLYNCSYPLDQKGEGTYNYRGNWNMLDQMIVSGSLLKKEAKLRAGATFIFKAEWLIYNDKRNGPTPSRTYGGPNYYGGFSDHYAIYMDLFVK